jgi:hypothetical protein
MRLLSLLAAILVISAVSVTLPAAPAQAADGPYVIVFPDDGVPGIEVRVRGYNFTANEWIDIYYDGERIRMSEDVETNSDGDFYWVTFEVPESHAGDHIVLVEDEEGKDAYRSFTVEPGLTINPDEGPVGTTVTVEGHGFADEEENIELRYYPNGSLEVVEEDIEADEDGWWQWSFEIPPSAQGRHEIDAEGDDSQDYDVEDAIFEVIPEISLDKSSGSPGESITMTGNGFEEDDRDITILFDEQEVATEIRADENGYWEASFDVPQMPTGEYSLTAEGELTKDAEELTFEIEPDLVLSPDEGHVGMNLTVTGYGYAPDEDVNVTYDDIQLETGETDDNGSFNVTVPVPESKHGAHNVTAKDDEGNSATATFTMESAAPDTPELISPPDAGRVGFIGRVTPSFNWSEVSDDSGVYYSLQIATSDNVTSTGEFADPIFTVDGVVATNYTLEKEDALSYGTHYWIVQAVDGADNESEWTEPDSFRAGALPLWAFIVIIVAAVAGIGALVYFRIIRNRIYYY